MQDSRTEMKFIIKNRLTETIFLKKKNFKNNDIYNEIVVAKLKPETENLLIKMKSSTILHNRFTMVVYNKTLACFLIKKISFTMVVSPIAIKPRPYINNTFDVSLMADSLNFP